MLTCFWGVQRTAGEDSLQAARSMWKACVATGLDSNASYPDWLCINEQVGVTLDIYAGCIGFRSQLGYWLSWMKFFVMFLS
jgi:hypothetical protein